MRLRFWSAGAKSGTVGDELTVSGSPSMTSRQGGGTASFDVDVSRLLLRGSQEPDAGAVARALTQTEPGLRSIVVTDEQKRVVGEWVVMRRARSTQAGALKVECMEWDGYPALRVVHTNYDVTSDVGYIAHDLLVDAFIDFNEGMQIAIPSQASGRTGRAKKKARAAYYSDMLDELGWYGVEWRVDVSGTWSGDRLVSVERRVAFGFPVLARASGIHFYRAKQGSRRGSAVSIDGGDDFGRYAQSYYVVGSGQGEKQPEEGRSDPTLTNAGYLNSTKMMQASGVEDRGVLGAIAEAKVAQSQNMRDPYSAVGIIDKLSALPRVGDAVRLTSDPVPAFPSGLEVAVVRVGEVSYSASGHFVDVVSVKAL